MKTEKKIIIGRGRLIGKRKRREAELKKYCMCGEGSQVDERLADDDPQHPPRRTGIILMHDC